MKKILLLILLTLGFTGCALNQTQEITFQTPEYIVSGTAGMVEVMLPIPSEDELWGMKNVGQLLPDNVQISIMSEPIAWNDYKNLIGTSEDIEVYLDNQRVLFPWFKYDNLDNYMVFTLLAEPKTSFMPVDSVIMNSFKIEVGATVYTSELIEQNDSYVNSQIMTMLYSLYRNTDMIYGKMNEGAGLGEAAEMLKLYEESEMNAFKTSNSFVTLKNRLNYIGEIPNELDRAFELMKVVYSVHETTETYDPATDRFRNTENFISTGIGACTEYASLYKALGSELGVESSIVYGESLGEPHAWNIVWLDEWPYPIYVDATQQICEDMQVVREFQNGEEVHVPVRDIFARDYTVFDATTGNMVPCDSNAKERFDFIQYENH